jgi:hypothetical protein
MSPFPRAASSSEVCEGVAFDVQAKARIDRGGGVWWD